MGAAHDTNVAYDGAPAWGVGGEKARRPHRKWIRLDSRMRGQSRSSQPAQTTTPLTQRRLRSIADAAAEADVSTRTIRRYIAEGRLTGYRVGPRLVKVDLADLDTLVRRIPTAGC